MSHPLIRRIFVLLLAVFVTAGMGLSAVQASTMSVKMMEMGAGMAASGTGTCHDCGSPGGAKAMTACVASACAAPMVAHSPLGDAVDLTFVPVRHRFQSRTLLGRDSVPDPYPPRTSHIG